jgi:hypothetical protein
VSARQRILAEDRFVFGRPRHLAVSHFFAFGPSTLSVVLKPQSDPEGKQEGPDDADQNSRVVGPVHFAFALSPISTRIIFGSAGRGAFAEIPPSLE